MIATLNPATEVVAPQLDRLHDRFGIHLDVPYSRVVELRLADRRYCEIVWALRETPGLETACSTRLIVALARNAKRYGEAVAIRLTVQAFRAEERETVIQVVGGQSSPAGLEPTGHPFRQ